MSDPVTVVTRTGFGSRILGSFVGVLIGFVLVIASVILLYWNEGRAVRAATALQEGERAVVEAQSEQVDRGLDGKLIHVIGPLTSGGAVRDTSFGVGGNNVVRLKRVAEMYQWKQSEKTETHNEVGGGKVEEKTYTYSKVWSDTPIDSSRFHSVSGHQNPSMNVKSANFDSSNAKLGAYRLDNGVLNAIDAYKPFAPENANPPNGFRREGDGFYRGQDSANAAIGDVRVSFEAVTAQTLSIVSAQAGGILAPYRASNGYEIVLAVPGVATAIDMLKDQEKSERTLTWILRAVGFGMMVFGFVLIAGPITALAMVLPFLGGLVGTGAFLVAFILALPITLFVIAISWIAHRPVLGIGLLAVGAVLLIGGIVMRHRRKAAKVAA